MQIDLFPKIDRSQLTEEMFEAYFECRKNKRNTLNALQFEKNLEKNVFELIDEVFTGNYKLGLCIAFIVNRPVKREVFAAAFRDRVIIAMLLRWEREPILVFKEFIILLNHAHKIIQQIVIS